MKNKFSLLTIAVLIVLAFSSCKQNVPQLALFVPKDAATVFVIDTKAITEKISSSGITLDSLANIFNKHENGLHWNDIENSGIDLTKSFFVFSKQNNAMQSGKTQSFGLIAQVADKSKLETFFKKQVAGTTIQPDNKYQYIDLGNGYAAGWNNEVLIISGVTTGTGNHADETQSHQQLTALFMQTESNSVASVKGFKDMLNKTGDIHFWSNASASASNLPMLGMTKISSLLQDTYTEGTVDFENGKAIASAASHFNKTMSAILDKYSSVEIDKSMISRYPGQVNGFGIVAFNPKVLLDILHYLGFDMMADNYISQMRFTLSDVMNAFKGDIAIMFSDFKMEDRTIPQMPGVHTKKPGGEFLLNAAVGDKTAFNKVMTGLVNKNILSKNGDQYQLGFFGGHDFVIEATDNNLFIASNDALVKSYQAGNNKSALANEVEKEINNKSMAMYIDIAAMLQKTNSSNTSALKTIQAAQATFKNFIASTDKTDNKSTKSNLEINFVNKNENSLASLVKFIAVAHDEDIKHKNNYEMHAPFADSIPDRGEEPEKDSQ